MEFRGNFSAILLLENQEGSLAFENIARLGNSI